MSELLMNSHIQMPRSILKRFENENHILFYYDVKDGIIKRGHSKSLYQEYGYYSNDTETFLDKYIESPLGKILKYIENTDFSTPTTTPKNMQDIVMRYIHALIARGPSMISSINQSAIFFRFLSEREQHDCVAIESFRLAQQLGLFSEYFITFMINETGIPFVLPTGGLYAFKNIINCPITPNRAITLVKKESSEASQLLDGDTCHVFFTNRAEHIMKMNVRAFCEEINKDGQYIVAPEIEVLNASKAAYFSEVSA